MYPVNAQILGEEEVLGAWKREGDVLFKWRGKDRCVKIFCRGDGRVAGFWKRYGGRYETVEVRGLPRYLKGEVKEVRRMLEGGYVRFLRDCVEVRARGVGGMMKGEGEEEVDFDKLLGEIEDVEERKVVQRAVKTLLKNDPEGKELSVEGKQIGAAGVQVLAQALEKNSQLQRLSLSGNQIGDAGAQVLAQALEKSLQLQQLNLRWNQIGDVGVQAQARMLEKNPQFQQLDLRGNQIGDAGAQVLAQALEKNPQLQQLDLSWNRIGNVGVQALAQALEKNPQLQQLYLSGNQVGDAGAQALAQALGTNSQLQQLNLSENQIGTAGVQALVQVLKTNLQLQQLNLSENQIGDASVQVLERKTKSVPILNAPSISKFGQLSSDRFFAVDKKLFNQIEEKLFSAKSAEEKTRVVVLRGDPGVGKAELATEFSILNFANYSVVWGFDAQSEEALNNSYRELADRFGLTNKSENISTASIRNQINVHLEKKTPWLLVFTNVDERESFFLNREQWFPKCGGCVLIVSKENSWQRIPENNVIEVPKLYRDESIELLKRFMPLALQEQYAQLDTLAEKLECVPLALMQAGNFIRERSVSQKDYRINTYLEAFNKKRAATRGLANHLAIVITTWQVTMDYMQKNHPIAYEALHLFAYLNSEDIPLEWVASWLKINGKIEDVEKTVHQIIVPLTAYRMIGYVEERKILRIQPLLQQVVRNNQTGALRREIIGQALDLVLEKFVSYENLPHAVKIVNFVNGERKKQQYLEKTAALLSKMAEYIQRQGDTLLAKKYYEQLLDIYRIIYDKSAIQVADVLKKLGDLLLTLKENENANECFDQYLNIYQAYYGQYSLEMAIALQNIGKKREAIETYTHILQACYRKEAQYSEQEILERLVNILPIQQEAKLGSLSLDLSGYGNLGNEVMIAVVKHFSNLTSLNLSGWCNLTDDMVQKIIQTCQNLEKLDLSHCNQLTNNAFSEQGNYSGLIDLNLQGCTNLTDKSLGVIIQNCSKLQELNLSECTKLTGETVRLISTLQELKILKLNQCDNLETQDVKTVIHSCQSQLQSVELRACEKLQELSFKTEQNLEELDLSENYNLRKVTFKNCLNLQRLNLQRCVNLQLLNLDQCPNLLDLNLNKCEELNGLVFEKLVETCEKLENLDLSKCCNLTGKTFNAITNGLSCLKSLNVSGCYNLTSQAFQNRTIQWGNTFRSLNVSGCYNLTDGAFGEIIKNCKQLESLNLSKCKRLRTPSLDNCASLRELNLNCCKRLEAKVFESVAEKYKNLRILSLKECPNLTDKALQSIIACNNLESLTISNCKKLRGPELTNCEHFKELHLDGCKKLKTSFFREIAEKCQNLQYLNLRNCDELTDELVKAIFKGYKKLKRLDVSWCDSLTTDSFQTIANRGSILQFLALNGHNNLMEKDVITIVTQCLHLKELNLGKCKNLSHKIIKKLRKKYPTIEFKE